MKKIINAVVIIVFVGIPILMFLFGGNNTFKENHTAETSAKIISRGSGCGSSNWVIKYTYVVNGKQLENWTCYSHNQLTETNININSEAKACYDPANPKDSSVVPVGYRCGGK